MVRKVYPDEFKKAAVEQVIVQRHTVSSVAQRLANQLSTRLIHDMYVGV